MRQSIENYIPSNNRSQIIETKNNILILDAYNANSSSMTAMLRSFSEQDYTNKIFLTNQNEIKKANGFYLDLIK